MPEPQALAAEEWNRAAAPCFDRVFADDDPFGQPFGPEVDRRLLLFPVTRTLEEDQFGALAHAAAGLSEDSFYFFTDQPWSVDSSEPGHQLWHIPFDFAAYDEVGAIGASALCSPSGRWGLLISDEDHAVVGGPEAFVAELSARFPPTEDPIVHWQVEAPDVPDGAPEEEATRLLEASKTAIPMRTGEPPGDAQVLGFLEFWGILRDLEREAAGPKRGGLLLRSSEPETGDWVPGLLTHLYGAAAAKSFLRRAAWR